MIDKETLQKNIGDYKKAKGRYEALNEICDVIRKQVKKIERQNNEQMDRLKRTKNKNTSAYNMEVFKMDVLICKYNEALKIQNDILKKCVQSQKEYDEVGDAILKWREDPSFPEEKE